MNSPLGFGGILIKKQLYMYTVKIKGSMKMAAQCYVPQSMRVMA